MLTPQCQANEIFEKPSFELEFKYSVVSKLIMMTMFFAGIFPLGALFAIFGLLLSYYVNKYMLLRHSQLFKVSYRIGRRAVQLTRRRIESIVFCLGSTDLGSSPMNTSSSHKPTSPTSCCLQYRSSCLLLDFSMPSALPSVSSEGGSNRKNHWLELFLVGRPFNQQVSLTTNI
mgnify:FL=1